MIIIDALVFLARESFGFFFLFYYILISVSKAFLLLIKPLWFIFYFVFSFIKTIFETDTTTALWTPSPLVITFFNTIPMLPTLLSTIGIILMVSVTIRAVRNEIH